MSVHNLTWVATSSGVGMTDVIHDALDWLSGGEAEISHEKVKSYHGPKMTVIRAKIGRKKAAREAICHLGSDLLSELSTPQELVSRIDDENSLHIRLDLAALVTSQIRLAEFQGDGVVKGRIKLEVYPGQECQEIARNLLQDCASKAERLGLPPSPE